MKTIDEIIDGYFEGTLSEHEETLLKAFLVSPEGQGPEYDEVRAVMGYFATGRSVILSEAKNQNRRHPIGQRRLSIIKTFDDSFLSSEAKFKRVQALHAAIFGYGAIDNPSFVNVNPVNALEVIEVRYGFALLDAIYRI